MGVRPISERSKKTGKKAIAKSSKTIRRKATTEKKSANSGNGEVAHDSVSKAFGRVYCAYADLPTRKPDMPNNAYSVDAVQFFVRAKTKGSAVKKAREDCGRRFSGYRIYEVRLHRPEKASAVVV